MTASEPIPGELFAFTPDPAAPGWYECPTPDTGRFIDIYGPLRIHRDGPATARIRFTPAPHHRNLIGTVHGGFLMAVVDQVLFLGPAALGVKQVRGAVTVDASVQFFASVRTEAPFDAVVELLRETRRTVFVRGLIEQEGAPAVNFTGTVRKAPPAAGEAPAG